jgi:hypothetical protein
MGLTGNTIGRPAREVKYTYIRNYVVGEILHKSELVYFVFDIEYFDEVKKYNWYLASDYIGTRILNKVLYLHNLIMNKLTFEGKGQKETVDHINRNPLDNRKCNLRIVSQTVQNMNQSRRKRRVTFPDGYSIIPDDLPKHVFYVSARGNHGDGFCVEFKKDGKKIYNPYIRSKVLTIEEKLEKIKVLLQQGYELHPEFNPEYENENRINLEREFQNIINGASQSTPASTFLNTE